MSEDRAPYRHLASLRWAGGVSESDRPSSPLPAISVFVLLLASAPLSAQTAAPLHRAAASITEADVKRRVGIIADDSMMGRDTPSRGLELTARYVADQFRRFGLRPAGGDGTWFVRYPVTRRRLEMKDSKVVF